MWHKSGSGPLRSSSKVGIFRTATQLGSTCRVCEETRHTDRSFMKLGTPSDVDETWHNFGFDEARYDFVGPFVVFRCWVVFCCPLYVCCVYIFVFGCFPF